MKSLTKATIAALVLSLGIGAGVAVANPFYHGPGHMTQEQAAKAQQLDAAHYSVVDPLARQLAAKEAERYAELASTTPDRARIEAISKDIGELQGKLYAAEASYSADLAKAGISGAGRCGYGYGKGHGYGCGGGYSYGKGYGGGHGGRHGGHW